MHQIRCNNKIVVYLPKIDIMGELEPIWVSLTIIRNLLGVNRTTIYRRLTTDNPKKKLESRINPISKRTEVKIPDENIEEYLQLIK